MPTFKIGLLFVFLIFAFLCIPGTTYAQTPACQQSIVDCDDEPNNPSCCNVVAGPTQIGTTPSCKEMSVTFECPSQNNARCYFQYLDQCTTPQTVNICNSPRNPASSFNCQAWCSHWGIGSTRYNDCIANSCRDARGAVTNGTSGNYTCPNACADPSSPTGSCMVCNNDHGCVTPSAVTTPPPSNCPAGQTIGGNLYTCNNGSSCPTGSTSSSFTCESNQVCCYSPVQCQYKDPLTVACQTIAPIKEGTPTNCQGSPPLGQYCPDGTTCTTNGCISNQGCSWTACSNNVCGGKKVGQGACVGLTQTCSPACPQTAGTCTTSLTSVGFTNASASISGDISGYNKADWWLVPDSGGKVSLGTNDYNGTNFTASTAGLNPNTGYSIYATLWSSTNGRSPVECARSHFTTNKPQVVTALQCWVPVGSAGQDTDIGRWRTGDPGGARRENSPNMNLSGPNLRVGEGCYRPGNVSVPPAPGSVGGRVYKVPAGTTITSLVNKTAPLTLIPDSSPHLFYWVYNSTGSLLCAVNNGSSCMTALNSANYYLSGTDANQGQKSNPADLFPNLLQLYGWPDNLRPLGYYRYQGAAGINCRDTGDGVQCEKYECQEKQVSQKDFFYWGGWVCDGCTGPPGVGPYTLVNAPGPNPGAPICVTDNRIPGGGLESVGANARIDWIFEERARYTISGKVFEDNNRNQIKDAGETGYNGALITISSTQVNTAITSSGDGDYSFADLLAGNYTLTLTLPLGYVNTTPTSLSVALSTNTTSNFGITPNNTVSGKIILDVNNDLCASGTLGPGYSNIRVTATPTSSGIQRSATSNSAGNYTISSLSNGNFLIQATPSNNRVILSPASAQYITTLPNSNPFDFCISQIAPWIQTEGASVHGRRIDIPGGP